MRSKYLYSILVLLVVLLALTLLASPAHAGGVVDECTEGDLMVALAGGGTVTFTCSGTITLTSAITITANTTIDGSGQAVTISGGNAVRVFTVNPGISLSLNELTIANGKSTDGGGVYNDGGTLTVSNSTFYGNHADMSGGGIYNDYGGSLTVTNSTFTSNGATRAGGIFNYGTLTVTNSTFTGNSAADRAGGIYNWFSSVSVSNSTFSGNSATGGGGGIYTDLGTLTLVNTIVASSISGGNCAGTTITDGGGNLSYPDTTCPGIQEDPMLGPLQDNGGLTDTMALLPDSPAIDAGTGSCAATDQRGVHRPLDGDGDGVAVCDIGAFESQPVIFAKPSPIGAGNCSSWEEACTIQAALTYAMPIQQIWVASGVYTPTTGLADPRSATFQLKEDVAVYGGFAGTETLLSQRDPAAHVTVLSGDLLGDDGPNFANDGENSYHVVTGADKASLDGVTIRGGNSSQYDHGGGIYIIDGTLNVANSTLSGNRAGNFGGGIYIASGILEVVNSTFLGNRAFAGGGIAGDNLASIIVSNSTFSGNTALIGGGILNKYILHVINSTFSSNSAEQGGGINNNSGSAHVINSTISGNSATSGGGIKNFGTVTLVNTIVANNISGGNCSGSFTDGGGNLSYPETTCPGINKDPLLGPLQDNGGSTQTMALGNGSPAIDAGTVYCADTDQRGVLRPIDGDGDGNAICDIGSFEYLLSIYLSLVWR